MSSDVLEDWCPTLLQSQWDERDREYPRLMSVIRDARPQRSVTLPKSIHLHILTVDNDARPDIIDTSAFRRPKAEEEGRVRAG
jgi:hypothetical protein